MTSPAEFVTQPQLREFELRIQVAITDLENRLIREISSMRNWLIGIVVALIIPVYVLMVTILIFLYNAKPSP